MPNEASFNPSVESAASGRLAVPNPKRVLIVEDEALVGMALEDALEFLGIDVAGVAGTVDEALLHVESDQFDGAILDVQLHGKTVLPVAELLERRGIPFVFATGYGKSGVPEKYRDAPVLQKPFMPAELKDVLTKAGICRNSS
jgi:CheY-like chemotaxis protein